MYHQNNLQFRRNVECFELRKCAHGQYSDTAYSYTQETVRVIKMIALDFNKSRPDIDLFAAYIELIWVVYCHICRCGHFFSYLFTQEF